MATNFNWSKIKGDFTGFEELAYEFVKKKFPHPNWKKTPPTRDGNRDAYSEIKNDYTIVFGFQPYQAKNEEWWMEAKYSTKIEVSPRYRLDATIVSAIISGNVSKVIFVTNTTVSAKTIEDIRSALRNAIGCKEVHFCTKYTLEHWLLQNPTVFYRFFPDIDQDEVELPNIFVTEELEFYSDFSNFIAFREPLQALEREALYYGYCSVFCNQPMNLLLQVASNLRGITIRGNRSVALSDGENTVRIVFELKKDYGERKRKRKQCDSERVPTPRFLLGDIELFSKKAVPITDRVFPIYKLKSQQNILQKLKEDVSLFIKHNKTTISFLTGVSAVGKSFIIQNLLSSNKIEAENVFSVSISHSDLENMDIFLRIVLFLMFPYIDAKAVNSDYIDDVGNRNNIGRFLESAICHRDDPDELYRLIEEHAGVRSLFPNNIQIGRRIVIIDDFHKATITFRNAIMGAIEEIYIKRIPAFVLVSAQPLPSIQLNNAKMETIPTREYKLELTQNDLADCIETKMGEHINYDSLKMPFNSALEIFVFIKFLDYIGSEINTIDDLKSACVTYYESRFAEEFILEIFKNAISHSPELKSLCESIYWSPKGLNLPMSQELEILFSYSLIRQGIDNEITPYHDMYVFYFKKHYPRPAEFNSKYSQNPLEQLRNNVFSNVTHGAKYQEHVEDVLNFVENRKFYSAFYVLDDAFSNQSHQMLKNMFGTQNYYELYMAYAIASTNLSIRVSGKSLFTEIYNETKDIPNDETQKICVKALWELTNSSYERLEFITAEEQAGELIERIRQLCENDATKPDIHQNINYHNAQVIKTLISSDMNHPTVNTDFENRYCEMSEAGFIHRALVFRLRYALTLMARNGEQAYSLIKESRDSLLQIWGEEEKFYLWGGMDAAYLRLILDSNPAYLKSVLEFQEKLKRNYYNDYRKSLLAMASYYFGKGEISNGNHFIFQDSFVSRELRPRQQGFYHETLALHDAVQDNFDGALENLEKAYVIFQEIPSYSKIVAHNIALLRDGKFNSNNICYRIKDDKWLDAYYIDPRCIW